MKQAIKFSVFLNSETRKRNKVIFERVIWSDDSVSLDYDELFKVFGYYLVISVLSWLNLKMLADYEVLK